MPNSFLTGKAGDLAAGLIGGAVSLSFIGILAFEAIAYLVNGQFAHLSPCWLARFRDQPPFYSARAMLAFEPGECGVFTGLLGLDKMLTYAVNAHLLLWWAAAVALLIWTLDEWGKAREQARKATAAKRKSGP